MSAFVCRLEVDKDSTYATILDLHGGIVNQTRLNNERVLSYLSYFVFEFSPNVSMHTDQKMLLAAAHMFAVFVNLSELNE
jgi:hypothetical protein